MEKFILFAREHQILSGSVAVILVFIVGLFINKQFSKKSKNQNQKVGNNSQAYQAGRDIKIEK